MSDLYYRTTCLHASASNSRLSVHRTAIASSREPAVVSHVAYRLANKIINYVLADRTFSTLAQLLYLYVCLLSIVCNICIVAKRYVVGGS